MKRFLIKFWALGLGIVVLATALASTTLLVRNHLDQETGQDHFLQISEEMKFDFTPQHNNINILVLRLKNPGLIDENPYELEIRQGELTLTKTTFSGINVGDPSDLRLQFAPLPDTQNKLLTVVIRPTVKSDRPLQIGLSADGGISFQVFYRDSQLSTSFAKYLKDPYFLFLWGGTIALLILYV